MTQSEALTRLQVLSQWQTHPTLSATELGVCLMQAKYGDAAWDLNVAAQQAWLLKAGKASDHHGTTVNSRRFDAQQIHTNCLAMAETYRKRIVGTFTVESA